MNKVFFCVVAILFSLTINNNLHAQTKQAKKHTVFLIGNTSVENKNLDNLKAFKSFLDDFDGDFSVIHLGDIINNTGSLKDLSAEDKEKMDILLSLGENPKGKVYFVPGDLDWDDSGRDGQKNVEDLYHYIEDHTGKDAFLIPEGSCPGPTVLDVAPHVRVIAFNSQWWIHPYNKPISTNTDCKVIEKEELLEEITDEIEDTRNRNLLVVSHHPVFSGGIYGGYSTPKMHLFPNNNNVPLPVVGSFYTAYRQNVGTTKDMAYPAYSQLVSALQKHFIFKKGLVFAAAHDYNLQLIEQNSNYQLVSGSLMKKEPMRKKSSTLYKKKGFGFLALEYYPDGRVNQITYLLDDQQFTADNQHLLYKSPCDETDSTSTPQNFQYNPCKVEEVNDETAAITVDDSIVVNGGAYGAGIIKRFFLGNLYRKSWTTPVKVPYIDLDTVKGGLTPYAVGGGRQTTSLKFKATNGKEYTFRSVNKDPIKALPPELRETVVVSLLREMTATQQPYGAMPVSRMLDATDILHARPKLYILPEDPRLGIYRKTYTNLFGMLEDDPSKPKDGVPGFHNADDVDRSFTMFRKIYDDNDVYVDARSFAKARVFDMLIGDWGRHPDNWKWALYEGEDKEIFYPIPRDRDHSFSKWDGLIPYLADREWARPNVQNFDYNFKGIRSLNWPARHLDRLLLTSLEKEDWINIAKELTEEITESVIDSAIETFPPEIIPVQGNVIREKLKSRRKQLESAVTAHYLMLAKLVDVLGSNKHEYFLIERLNDGNVNVKVYKKKKEDRTITENAELIYERLFLMSETDEIRLYGLDGEDVFDIKGNVPESIKIRVIGGEDDDVIIDESAVTTNRKATIVYDRTDTKLTAGNSTVNKLSEKPGVNLYNRTGFKYNTYMPMPLLSFNADDGIGFKFGIDWTRHGFRKEPFKQKYGFDFKVGTQGSKAVSLNSEWTDVFGKWSLGTSGNYANIFPFYNYFGLGNGTVKENLDNDYFRTNYKGLDINVFTRKTFWVKSFFKGGFRLEDYQSVIRDNSILDGESITGIDPLTILSAQGEVDINFRNNDVYATKGLRLNLKNQSGWLLNEDNKFFTLSEAFAEYYSTFRILTLAFKVGGAKNTGDNIPYFKYANLGQKSNLRGYLRNRFAGTSSLYFNTEARIPVGTIKNPVLPFVLGFVGFVDSGRVWFDEPDSDIDTGTVMYSDNWHTGFGGGIYLVPIVKSYTLSLTAATSEEESVLFTFGLGFGIGR